MVRFQCARLAIAIAALVRAGALLGIDTESSARRGLSEVVFDFNTAINELPISLSLRLQTQRLQQQSESAPISALIQLVTELQTNLESELLEPLFLCVPSTDAGLYRKPEAWFGDEANAAFPLARDAMQDCGRCLALNQGTAAVFHAMSILEHGLHRLATMLRIEFVSPIQLQNWGTIIERIEKAIRDMEGRPRSSAKSEELQFYSKVATHVWYAKEAWRNHVSHGRARYSDEEARRITEHVRDMMSEIASRQR